MPRSKFPQPETCGCGGPIEAAYLRHAAQDEYDALPDALKPIDGVATVLVKCCGDCLPGPICEHPNSDPVPCPRCGAEPGQPCTRPGGAQRFAEHRERAAAQPVPQRCTHHHRETCTDPRECQCSANDAEPPRIPRTFLPATAHETAADLGFPPGAIPDALAWMSRHQINPALVRSAFRTGYTQTNEPALLFDYAQPGADGAALIDEHGHEVVSLRIEPVELPPSIGDGTPRP